MSTLNTMSRLDRRSEDRRDAQVEDRFQALVRSGGQVGPDAAPVEFGTVFDLDYGQRRLARVPQQRVPAPGGAPVAPQARPCTVEPAARRGVVRLTRRGRLVATLVFLGVALGLMLSMGGFAVASQDAGSPEPVRVVTVQPGDSLYEIASDLAAPGEIRSMVLRIQELNSLPSATITEGQKLAVPRG